MRRIQRSDFTLINRPRQRCSGRVGCSLSCAPRARRPLAARRRGTRARAHRRAPRRRSACLVRFDADPPVERQRAEQRHAVLRAQRLAAVLAEDVLLVPAIRADVQAHVLHDAEHRHADLLEHLETLARVGERDVLRRRDDHRAAHRHPLRESELDVARAGRHVDDQIVEVAPVRLREQLVQRRRDHRATPGHRLLVVDEEADRHCLEPVRDERLERLAVARLGSPAHQAQHSRLARAVDVGVQDADAGAFSGERERDVNGDRRLADAALAGRHRDEVPHARQRLQPRLDGVRDDRRRHVHGERRTREDWLAVLGYPAL